MNKINFFYFIWIKIITSNCINVKRESNNFLLSISGEKEKEKKQPYTCIV